MKAKVKKIIAYNKKSESKEREKAANKEMAHEWKRINYFFEWFDVDAATEHLWEILKLALVADNDHTDERERSNMIFFYEGVKELFE
ncbi:MAG: hypothetical protein ABI185_07970, partial [Ginsengibacter sp.]